MTYKTCTFTFLLTVLLVTSSAALASDRQTEFNDDNYQPRGAVNVIPGVTAKKTHQPKKAARQAKPAPKQQRVSWQWEGAGFAKANTSSGVFFYQVERHSINTTTLCNNYTPGSLIYRDCRKAAKRYFTQQCSSGFPQACGAAGMTP